MKTINLATDDAKELIENPRIVESLRRSLDEKDVEIQRLLDENLSLNDKIKHLHRTAIENDKRLDELDQQHTEALQNLVLIKNELQENVAVLKKELETVRRENEETVTKFNNLTKDHADLVAANQESLQKFEELEGKFNESNEERDRLKAEVEELQAQLTSKSTEIAELLEEKEAHSREGSDKFEMIDLEKEKMTSSMEINRLQTELDEINARLSILNDIKDQYDSNVLKLGSVVSEKSNLEEEVKRLRVQNENRHLTLESIEKIELLQKSLDEINLEKEQSRLAFVTMQGDQMSLQKDFEVLRNENEELESTRVKQEKEIVDLREKFLAVESKLKNLTDEYEKLQSEHGECEDRISELQKMHDTLKSQAVDVESSLMEENMMAQKQVIDLQSALNSRKTSESDSLITFEEFKAIVSKSLSYETSSANNTLKLYLDAFLRSVKDTYQHLEDIEVNRNNLMKQFESVSTEKATLQHEYKTLKADLHHYEKEVEELMKNNGILLNQLENVKAGKLETILENNEDSVLRLECQLEETSKLNVSLQDEFDNLTHKLDESEEEKYELIDKISHLQQQLDQMRTDDSKLEIQKSFEEKFNAQNVKIVELNEKIGVLTAERDDLCSERDNLAFEVEEKKTLLEEIEELKQCKQADSEELERLRRDFDDLEEDYKLAENSAEDEKTKLEAQIDDLNKTIDELQEHDQKTSTDDEGLKIELTELQRRLELLLKEKQELVNAIQTKHNENIQYHTKIQELNQMLMTLQQTITQQSQQLTNCATCAQFTEKLSASHNEIATLTDQVTFLKEKSDILTQNLLLEQTNQKILQQEKIQLNEDKQALNKDLNRLREHLIEMENAHTAEMIELQNVLELTRHEVTNMQEEARKSNTAYTSAR